MAADGSVIIDVLLDDDEVTSGMRSINDSVDDLKGIAKTVAASLAVVGAAAGAAFIGFSKSAIVAAAETKALNSQFETVFKELEKTATGSLNKIAEETGIVPSRLKGTFTQIAAFAKTTGMDTANALSLTERATLAAADSAAFYDKSIESTAESLQSFLKGNFENDAALGISATETTRNAKANELYGKSFIKLSENQKQFTLLAMVEDGNKLSGALGQAAKESDGLENLLGNLKQAWYDLLVEFGTPILPTVTEWLKKIGKAIQDFDATPFIKAFTLVWDALDKFASNAVNIYKTLKSSISSSGGLLEALGIDANFLAKLYGYLVKAQETFKHAFERVKTVVKQAFTFIMSDIVPILAQVVGIIMANIETVREIFTVVFDAVIAVVTYAFEFIQTYIVPILNDIVSFIGEQLAVIRQFWTENGAQIVQAVTNAFNMVKAVIDFIMPAVLFVIDYIWTAIKQVITGALDVIMGLIKVFSGLFTGDFGKMWEGIKQIFFGAIDLIIGWMSLTFVGGLRTLLTNLAKAGFNLLKGMWDDIAKVFTNMGSTVSGLVSKMASSIVNYFVGILTRAQGIFGTLRTFGASIWNSIRSTISNIAQKIWNDVVTKFTGLVSSIKNIFGTVKSVITNIWNGVLTFFKGIDLTSIGKNIIIGLINGIGSMASTLTEKVKSIASSVEETARKVLGIHSPSLVMDALGRFTMIGFNNGMSSQAKNTEKIIKNLGAVLTTSTKANANEVAKIASEAEKQRTQIQKESAQKIKDAEKNLAESIADIQTNAYSKKRKLNANENTKIERLRRDFDNKMHKLEEDNQEKFNAINEKTQANMSAQEEKLYKGRLDAIKQFIEDKKSLDQLSIIDEARVWEVSLEHFKVGTKERVDAQKSYASALDAVNSKIVSINETYSSKVQSVNDKLIASEKALNDAYNTAFSNRVGAIVSFAGLFDEFTTNIETTGTQLLGNLQSQVVGLEEWRATLDSLGGRIGDQALVEELEAMGPNALGELKALNSMTDEQLTQYASLYQQKSNLARIQAQEELSGMKEDTVIGIEELRAAANKELDVLERDWLSAMKDITRKTDNELSTLRTIGVQAGQGLLNGLASMEGALVAKATAIAEAVKNAISGALDIHSPSRWMKDFVAGNMAKGWIEGIDKSQSTILNKASQLGEWMKPDVSGGFVNKLRGVAAPIGNLGSSSLQNIRNNSNSNSYDQSKTMHNQITIQETTDTSKAVEKVLRRLQFQFN